MTVGKSTRKYFALTDESRARIDTVEILRGRSPPHFDYPALTRDAANGSVAVQTHVRYLSFQRHRDLGDLVPRMKIVRTRS